MLLVSRPHRVKSTYDTCFKRGGVAGLSHTFTNTPEDKCKERQVAPPWQFPSPIAGVTCRGCVVVVLLAHRNHFPGRATRQIGSTKTNRRCRREYAAFVGFQRVYRVTVRALKTALTTPIHSYKVFLRADNYYHTVRIKLVA